MITLMQIEPLLPISGEWFYFLQIGEDSLSGPIKTLLA